MKPAPLTMEEWTVIVQALDRAEACLSIGNRASKMRRPDCIARLRSAIPLAIQGRDALANAEAPR